MHLLDSIANVKSIGEKRLKLFNKINIFTVKDLIEHYPRDYEDRSNIKKIDELLIDCENVLIGKIKKDPENVNINSKTLTKLIIFDETGEITLTWFNRPFLKKYFIKGNEYIFYGKVVDRYGKLQMDNADYEWLNEKELLSFGRIVPIYKTTYGLTQKFLRNVIKYVLNNYNQNYKDYIPKLVLEKFNLCDKTFAIKNIHFPNSEEGFFYARERLVFEELFFMQIALNRLKKFNKSNVLGKAYKFINFEVIKNLLPYQLTNSQNKVLNEIVTDLKSGMIVNRLIQGDVGSGKTVIALICCYLSIKNGLQASIMAPTEILAKQHYDYFSSIFNNLSIKTTLLSGSLRKKEKEEALFLISSGESQMIIGTHALIQKGVVFKNLGLVITDEQHRFGVKQRETLSEKGEKPHSIVMTATPIPRTLAIILYGDLDISVIDELPPNRQKIDTFHVDTSYLERIYKFIEKEIEQQHQCYIICPLIEESESIELKDVISYTEKLKIRFKKNNVVCIHGKMKQEEKNFIMSEFLLGNIQIIVSTTVIEVGINVPNATIIVIENAERFGLSQLHQLRGRVGRGKDKSYCVLVSDSKNKYTKQRLKAMTNSSDGFYISELDLKLRGPGDFFGTRQHGIPEFKIANLYKDMKILEEIQIFLKDFNFKLISIDENLFIEEYIMQNYNFFEKNISL